MEVPVEGVRPQGHLGALPQVVEDGGEGGYGGGELEVRRKREGQGEWRNGKKGGWDEKWDEGVYHVIQYLLKHSVNYTYHQVWVFCNSELKEAGGISN